MAPLVDFRRAVGTVSGSGYQQTIAVQRAERAKSQRWQGSDEAEPQRSLQDGGDGVQPKGVKPRAAERRAKKVDEGSHAHAFYHGCENGREAGQRVDEVANPHQVVIPAHRIPILGEEVSIGIPLMLFDQEVAFDAPAVACPEVAALVDIGFMKRATGDPGMSAFC